MDAIWRRMNLHWNELEENTLTQMLGTGSPRSWSSWAVFTDTW
jgi:hypothetical protein